VQASSRWILSPSDPLRASELAGALGLSPLTGQLLLNRGIADADRARKYLEPKLADLRRPDEMAGFQRAVERLDAALSAGQTIGIFGDYDVDGVTSCALLTSFLRDVGGRIVPRVARRDAGYGFSPAEVAAFAEAGCALIVTCDLGTSDHEAMAAARERGIDVIVVDHHQVPDREPELLALINPHQPACRFPFKGLASVGVAFYLAAALRTRLKARGRPGPDPRLLLDLVAVGTVCDMAPLTDENRILVHHGLYKLIHAPRPGLRALARIAGLEEGVRRTADIGLRLGPRLNAPGRIGAAQLALDLLLAGEQDAQEVAERCEEANKKRQELQERVVTEALAQAEAHARNDHAVLVVHGDGWHPGVVGIVAARLVDRFHRPSVVIAMEGDTGRASLRSHGGLDLVAALKASHDLLVRYGGHAAAAGLTVERKHLTALRERLQEVARAHASSAAAGQRQLAVDAEVELAAIDQPFAEELRRLEPYGVGNPEPLLGARGVILERARTVGATEQHLQVTLRDGDHARDGIGWNLAEQAEHLGSRVRAAFFPELDTWRGVTRVRVRLRDLAPEPA
jgi:single-stranded-DNA-specific exonuclease